MAQNSGLPFAAALQYAATAARGHLRNTGKLFTALIDGSLVVSSRVVVGTIASTATLMTVNLGFTPDAVEVMNVTDGKQLNWYGQTSDTGILFSTQATVIASGGVIPITTTGSEGFSVGTNIAGISKALRYIAYRNRPTT